MIAPSHSPATTNHTPTMHHTPTPATDLGDTPAVHWPDPSPLDHWWTEVMDGVLTPVAAPSAGV
ncbi:hypothetical protein [Nocardia nepalensis]|uniref:hypothetical protein n=1 Tax=Nocardia nepalensis TaxID=3375448 RepID=UPI003B67A80A